MARINFYQVSDPHPRFHKLVNLALGPLQYGQSAAMIFLDWGRPWLFLENIQKWLRFLELAHLNVLDHGCDPRMLNDPDAYTTGKAMMEELTTLLARYIQDYKDAPISAGEDRRAATTAPLSPINLPQGCLSRNLGIPLIIVCTKSDKIKQVEREGDYKENHFDFIQQTLRTICLQYGATLIYTSIHRPSSFALLRNYLLHRLFGASGSGEISQAGEAAPTPSILPSYLNNFKTRGLMVERESVFVPSGWDSFNKIRVLRESFLCGAIQRGMTRDLISVIVPHAPPHHQSRLEAIASDNAAEDEEEHESLSEFYSSIIPLPFSATRQAALSTPEVAAQPEQAFLAAHFAMFQGMDSASSYFPNPLPYVGTAADKTSRTGDADQSTSSANLPSGTNNATGANSFFKMLSMKDNAK
ncbi:hypothetical protein DSO57_1016361 [Entomophthora muscae]|uniref:Uncharacterized protein n=1 Tax=Entomophthora muscae TaxID=34485 RepID=A0ACC2UQE1_9FUNG|nr:hypothetical protein DSO57_1016361 [Entomophthora muscae]